MLPCSPAPRLLLLVAVLACAASAVRCSGPRFAHLDRVRELHQRERRPPAEQVDAAVGLLARLLPSHSASFEFRIVSTGQCGGKACFIINNHPSFDGEGTPEILILGVTGVEISAGLHWYLKHYCAAHISWAKTGGAQLSSVPYPGSLPHVPAGGVLIQRPVDWSYYQNAVTSSYSFAWYDWERWEKEIDWMALQGINLPLAFTGQETIWQKVFQRYNISKSDLDDFFGGPAFLSWSRMANMHGWGGPLPQTWLDDQLTLQKKILSRMYAFGMSPVLPAFSGNIPAALKSKFPSARVTHLGDWFTVDSNPQWCCTYLLDASDPLFVEIGKSFIEEQIKEYGRTSHVYNCDTFDENTPPLSDPNYISSLGAATFRGMQSGDDDAIWLMQGWLFTYDPFWEPPQMKALLHSVSVGRMIVLDLYAEVKPVWINSDQFYGVPYIWCMLHNFAADFEMYGVLDAVASGPIDARLSENSTMVGVGMSMEGIEQNPIVYDLMSEMAFHHRPVDLQVWVETYPTRRYGKSVMGLQDAWRILHQTLYNCTDGKNTVVSKMKRDMKKLEDEAATSAKSAESEKQHSLKLEKDLQVLAAELAKVKKESAEAKKAAQKAHTDLRAVLDVCQKGIKAMCHHIFGADSPKLKLPTSQQLHSVLDHCHGLQEGARSVVKYLNSKGKYPKEPERLVDELSRAPGYMRLWKQSAMRRSAIRILALAHSYYPTVLEPAMLTMGKPEQHEDGKPFTQDDFKAEELLVRPYACEIANKMDPEVWVHHYDLENKRVNPGVPPIVNFGRPSQDMTGAPSTGPSSSTPAAPRTGDLTGAEPTLKTPAAPTPSRVATGGSQIQEELSKHMKNPRGTGYQTKKVATKSPGKSTSASAAQAKDKSPAKDSTAPVKDSIPVKDNSLDDF